MSEIFYYVNHTKSLRFDSGDLGQNNAFSYIGYGLGGRAFCLLLSCAPLLIDSIEPDQQNICAAGAWIGDRVECAGSGYDWQAHHDYVNIIANIIVLLYRADGFEPLFEVARHADELMLQLIHLAATCQCPPLARDLERVLGPGWSRTEHLRWSGSRVHNLVIST